MRTFIILMLLSGAANATDYHYYAPLPPSDYQYNFDTLRRSQQEYAEQQELAARSKEMNDNFARHLDSREAIEREILEDFRRRNDKAFTW